MNIISYRPAWLGKLLSGKATVVMSTLIVLLLAGCEKATTGTYQGYAEGEFVRIAVPFAGELENLSVQRGQQVAAGAPLFALESADEQAAKREAEERLRNADARLANLQTGKRLPEVEATQADVAQAEAARELSKLQLRRQQQLFSAGFIPKSQLDEARATHRLDTARLAQTMAQVQVARQTVGRDAEIRAAQAEVEAARAVLAQSEWRLEQKSAAAPVAALVQDTYYTQGEWVPAGSPIVSLLPPGNIKLRFFVPEAVAGSLHTGQPVSVACDGCGAPIPATVSYISPQAEYTPPVIYSKESRAKLVFLIEARPEPALASRLHPGQPVDVTLTPP